VVSSVEHQPLWSPEEIREELMGSVAIAVQRGNTWIMDGGYFRTIKEASRLECPIGVV